MFHRREAFRKSGKMIVADATCIFKRWGGREWGEAEHCLKCKKGHFLHCSFHFFTKSESFSNIAAIFVPEAKDLSTHY